ncbi:MAG TPA: protein kinase [Kofleriaceae bacterium]|nr:protein kinase [Kofleriaceae bacterium]
MEVPGVVGLSRIGTGGFAEVYRGVLGESGDPVAVKVFAPGTEPRVEREAYALTEVGPPVVPRLFRRDFTPEGRPVLIMELVSGTSLASASVTQATTGEKLDALWRLAMSVDRLHDAGWTHRDLKPDHVVLRPDEQVTLLDLGAALRSGADALEEPAVDPMALTADGAALGTPRYMAPEQCTGERAIGPAADIYAMGVIAFELLASRPPFVGEPAIIRGAHMATQPPRLSSFVDVPKAVDEVLLRCLAKDPSQRHESATEFAAALTAALARGSDERPLVVPGDASPRRVALLALRSRRSVVDIDRALGARAILARAQGDRLVIALPAPGPASTAVLAALRLADRLRAALEIEDAVVHVAELRIRRRGERLACAGPALDDLGWADRPALSEERASLTATAAGELDPATLAIVTGASGAPTAAREPTLVGRAGAVDAVASDAARGPGLATVLGGPGLGKTRFLAELAKALEDRGIAPVARVSARDLSITRGVPLAAALEHEGVAPAAILIDDAHVADSAALDAIELASLDVPSAWVCVAALPELVTRRPGWDARALRASRWDLAPLGDADAAAMLRELLAAEFMPEAVVDRLIEASGGVPLHLVEVALALHRTGALRARPGTDGIYIAADHLVHLSSTPLGERMAERALSELPPSTVRFARLCAVLGDDIDLADVAAAQRASAGEAWVDAQVGLHRLSAAGIVTQIAATRWRFHHPMLRQGILAGTPAEEREQLHRSALSVEEARSEPRYDRLAEHAAAVGDREKAWAASVSLAEGSARAGHWMEAELAWSAALSNLAASDPRREQALVGRGHARERLQEFEEALADIAAARELAMMRSDRPAAANLWLDEATLQDWRWRWDESHAAAVAARELVGDAAGSPVAARLDLALGRSAGRAERVDQAVELLTRAADTTEADEETRTIALLMLAYYLTYADRNHEAEERFRQVISLCAERGDDFHLAAALNNRFLLWSRLDRFDEAEQDLRRAIDLARRHGAAPLERFAHGNLASLLYMRGDPDSALPLATRAVSLQVRFSGPDESDEVLLLARVHLARGEFAAAEEARRRAGVPTNPQQRVLARIVDLVLRGAAPIDWSAAEDEILGEAPYAEIAIEFFLWAVRSALKAKDWSRAHQWLERARERAGSGRVWERQISDLAAHVGEVTSG